MHRPCPKQAVGCSAVRLIVARCEVTYTGRLSAFLPVSTRLLMIKADGSVPQRTDVWPLQPLNTSSALGARALNGGPRAASPAHCNVWPPDLKPVLPLAAQENPWPVRSCTQRQTRQCPTCTASSER